MSRPILLLCGLLLSSSVLAQDKPKGVDQFNEFNAKPLEGWVWDEDERLQDLIEQLQEKELILQEIDAKIAKATGKKASSKMAENMAWRSTQRMDLNGGGPIRWDAFYGRNAENFFYHPKDPNTSYHTNTVLQQVAPTSANGVAGNQGVPAHQRPPQFDYIYRGYENAQARAREQARDLANRIDEMKSRRRELEGEVVVLWMKLAFRVIDRDKLPENAALRFSFKPKAAGNDDASEQALALTSATQFLATAMLFNDALVEESPDSAFGDVSKLLKENRKAFEDGFLNLQSLRKEASDKTKPIGQFKFLSRELEDTAKTLSEGYKGWQDGDKNEEESAKFAGLRRIQDGVVRYSKILLALNELAGQMEKAFEVDLNTDSNEFTPRWDVSHVPPTPLSKRPPVEPQKGFVPVRITYHYAADGKTTTTVKGIAANASDGPSRARKKIAPGVWRFTHVFRDESSLETVGGPLKLDRVEGRVTLDRTLKALVFPTDIHGAFQYPYLFRGPSITVDIDVMAKAERAALLIALPQSAFPHKPDVQFPSVVISTTDGFHTVDSVDRWNTNDKNRQETITEAAALRQSSTREVVTHATINSPPDAASSYWFAISNRDKTGFYLRRLSVEGRGGPRIGVELSPTDRGIVANIFDGPAKLAGVSKGDRIVAIAGKRPTSVEAVYDLINETDFGETWKLEVEREGKRREFSIKNRD
jgi:hypothetical protein